MENPRPEKVAVVDEVKARLTAADAAVFTEYRGLTVKDLAELRRQLRPAGGEYKIYKNTLVRFAVRDLDLASLEESLTGPTAIAFIAGDPVAVAKTLRDFSRANPNLIVKGGVLGNKVLTAADAAALADLPSREVVLAQLAGLLAQPLRQFAGLLQALPRNFAYGLQALVEKGGAADDSGDSGSAHEALSVSAPGVEEVPAVEPGEPEATAPAEASGTPAEPDGSDAEAVPATTTSPAVEAAPDASTEDASGPGPTDQPASTDE